MPHFSNREILALAMVPLFGVSTLFVLFGFSIYSLLTQSLNTLLLIGIYWKMSDLVKQRQESKELIARVEKTERELEAIKQR